jgi:hypothetical protein
MWGFSFDDLARRAQEEAAKLAVRDELCFLSCTGDFNF